MRRRKAWRDLGDDPLRTLLVILSMTIGIFAFGAIIGGRDLIERELNHAFLATQPTSILINTDPFTTDLVEAARRWPGVALANGRREIPVRVQIGPDDWNDLHLVIIDFDDRLEVNRIDPEEGAWPPPRHTLLLERRSPMLFHTAPGESIYPSRTAVKETSSSAGWPTT